MKIFKRKEKLPKKYKDIKEIIKKVELKGGIY